MHRGLQQLVQVVDLLSTQITLTLLYV
jgi:hypothetical protein